jgi:putative endonuclease
MSSRATGAEAEAFVAAALERRGWRVLARNLRTPYAELDLLIETPAGECVVVEVKSRHPLSFVHGEDQLPVRQRQRLERALAWLAAREERRTLRLDLALVRQSLGQVLDWELVEGLALIEAP